MAGTKSTRRKCRNCGKPLPRLAREHLDPYCSVTCCKAAYGVVDKAPKLRVIEALNPPQEKQAA